MQFSVPIWKYLRNYAQLAPVIPALIPVIPGESRNPGNPVLILYHPCRETLPSNGTLTVHVRCKPESQKIPVLTHSCPSAEAHRRNPLALDAVIADPALDAGVAISNMPKLDVAQPARLPSAGAADCCSSTMTSRPLRSHLPNPHTDSIRRKNIYPHHPPLADYRSSQRQSKDPAVPPNPPASPPKVPKSPPKPSQSNPIPLPQPAKRPTQMSGNERHMSGIPTKITACPLPDTGSPRT